MESKRSKKTRRRSASDTHDRHEATELYTFLAPLKIPWEEFHRAQTECLSRIAAEIGVPPDQITDVLQEVWLALITGHERFQGEDVEQQLSSWLGAVTRNKSRDALRRLGRRREQSLDDLPAEPMDRKTKGPAELVEVKERDERLTAWMEESRKKNPLNCQLLCAHVLEGQSLQRLATETGLSVHAISCRISRIKNKLRYRLSE
jgi:RNA polymerase sigma factor (sigma-70 family)